MIDPYGGVDLRDPGDVNGGDARPDTSSILDAYGHRPFWRGRLHFFAALIALPAGVALVMAAHTTAARVSTLVYAICLVGVFSVSAAYHRLARTPSAVMWFRRLDHSMIFLLIAGSYTPLCLVALPAAWGIPMLAVVWTIALAGITLKMVRVRADGGDSGSWLYLVLGWAAVVVLPVLVTSLSVAQLFLMAAGGMLYTLGAIGLWRRWPDPAPHSFGYHEVWHSLTIAAGACHFVLMAAIIR